jgi:hypothetical protein
MGIIRLVVGVSSRSGLMFETGSRPKADVHAGEGRFLCKILVVLWILCFSLENVYSYVEPDGRLIGAKQNTTRHHGHFSWRASTERSNQGSNSWTIHCLIIDLTRAEGPKIRRLGMILCGHSTVATEVLRKVCAAQLNSSHTRLHQPEGYTRPALASVCLNHIVVHRRYSLLS